MGIKSVGEVALSGTNLKTLTIPYTVLSIVSGEYVYYSDELTIKGYKHSYAQSFAEKYNITFKSIGETPKMNITAQANNTAYGSVSGGGKIYYGKTCKLIAAAKSGYKFVKWVEGSKTLSTAATYSFTVTKAHNIKAVFEKK